MDGKYKGYRIPKALIGYAIRLYFRYKLSLYDVRELLIERGLIVTYESIRLWVKNLVPVVDSEGQEIGVLLQGRRDAKSAIRFLKKPGNGQGIPLVSW